MRASQSEPVSRSRRRRRFEAGAPLHVRKPLGIQTSSSGGGRTRVRSAAGPRTGSAALSRGAQRHSNSIPIPLSLVTDEREVTISQHLEAFLEMLAAERGAATLTLAAYQNDLSD